jgi:hypothetical protein
MAQLTLLFNETEFIFQLNKIDRSSLYGHVDLETQDEEGRPCKLVTLAGDGKTLIGSGGFSIAYLSPDGEWCDKSDLKPVDMNGTEIKPVLSTLKTKVRLEQKASVDEYLSHNIRSVYRLDCYNDTGKLSEELGKGTIYSFPFSYRGGLEADTGFLLTGMDGGIFLCVGNKTQIEFIGFRQMEVVEPDEYTEEELDFGMM